MFSVFEIKTWVSATKHVHRKNRLGEGEFGAVFKETTLSTYQGYQGTTRAKWQQIN